MIPGDLLYTEEHLWVSVEQGQAIVGFTEYAWEHLGGVSAVELPDCGEKIVQMEVIGTVESGEDTADLLAPLSGTVAAVNEDVIAHPDLIEKDPYGDGWLVKLSRLESNEQESLLDPEAYRHLIEES